MPALSLPTRTARKNDNESKNTGAMEGRIQSEEDAGLLDELAAVGVEAGLAWPRRRHHGETASPGVAPSSGRRCRSPCRSSPLGYPSAATSEAAAGDGDGERGGSFLCGIFSFLSLTLTNHKFHEGFFFEKVS